MIRSRISFSKAFAESFHPLIVASVCAAFLFAGCGTDDDEDSIVSARVVDMELENEVLSVGESTVLQTDFSFDASDVFDDEQNVSLVIQLPPSVQYVEGTAEIQTPFEDDKIGARITFCPESQETFLVFDMDRFDLDDASNPEGDADARLNLTIRGLAPGSLAFIKARADANPIFDCISEFVPEASVAITVR